MTNEEKINQISESFKITISKEEIESIKEKYSIDCSTCEWSKNCKKKVCHQVYEKWLKEDVKL